MKKVLLVMIILLFCINSNGQFIIYGDSKYKLIIEGFFTPSPPPSGIWCTTYMSTQLDVVDVYFNNGSILHFIGSYNSVIGNFKFTTTYTKLNDINYISFKSGKIILLNGNCTYTRGGGDVFNVSIPVYMRNHYMDNYVMNSLISNLKVKMFPEFDFATSTKKILTTDDSLKIILSDSLNDWDYNWYCSIAGGTKFLLIDRTPILDIKISDLVKVENYGKLISIWIEGMGGLGSSNPITFTVLPSAPHISSVKSIPTTCRDIDDGKIVLDFDRTLFSGETLEVLLQGRTVDITTQLSSSTQVTIPNLAPGTYTINLFGSYRGNNTYTDAPTHKATVTVGTPTAVVFDTSVTPIRCFEGSDGEIQVTASGGVGNYAYNKNDEGWTSFSSTSIDIKNLAIGSYTIKVQDGNGCIAKVSGVEKVVKVNMTMPAAAVKIVDTSTTQPRGYGLSNGYIVAEVAGGTNNAGRYTYEWYRDAPNGIPMTTNIVKQVGTSGTYTERLDKIVAGTYYLTVKDKNYPSATSNQGNCGLKDIEFIVNQPDPLLVNILVDKKISCHVDNGYSYKIDRDVNGIPDEAEDGTFKSRVSGGVGSYRYEWQKQGSSGYQPIAGATTGNLAKITGGNYKLIVTDANDNQTIADTLSYYPDKLEAITTGSMVKCNSQKEGEVSVVAKGGVGNYVYEWNTSDNTPKVMGLGAGTYEVIVTDANKCRVNKKALVEQPGSLKISDSIIIQPKCYQDKNGSIEVMVSGGKMPYEVKWDNLMQGTKIDNIGAGKYLVTITDANLCSITQGYGLNDPPKIVIDLGKDITLCKGDSISLNATINDVNAAYQWIDATKKQIANTSSIILKDKGMYSVIAQDSKGCKGGDTIQISLSDALLSPEFLINTHVYTGASVKMVNTSSKQPQSVSWVVPNNRGIKILNQSDEYIELEFANAGNYKLGLKGMEGLCEKIYYKDIVVEENEMGVDVNGTEVSNIVEYTLNPNSNKGEYIVKVKLNTGAPIRIKLMDMEGKSTYTPINKSKATNFEIPINYNLKSGVYIMILETGNEAQVRKLVVE